MPRLLRNFMLGPSRNRYFYETVGHIFLIYFIPTVSYKQLLIGKEFILAVTGLLIEALEGWPCNRESFSEFNRHSTEVPTFPFLAFFVPGCNRQAENEWLLAPASVPPWRKSREMSSSSSTFHKEEILAIHCQWTIRRMSWRLDREKILQEEWRQDATSKRKGLTARRIIHRL